MNSQQATHLSQTVLELMHLTVRYEALYIRGRPTHDSPDEAWVVFAEMLDKQTDIAKQLDPGAIYKGKSSDLNGYTIFNTGTDMYLDLVVNMFKMVGGILYSCIQLELKPDSPPDIHKILIDKMQFIISRQLDPEAVRIATKVG